MNERARLMMRGVPDVSTSIGQVAAVDAAAGKTLWVRDPRIYRYRTPVNLGFLHRGVADGPALPI